MRAWPPAQLAAERADGGRDRRHALARRDSWRTSLPGPVRVRRAALDDIRRATRWSSWPHPCHIWAHSPRLRSRLPHLHWDRARPCQICTGTGLTARSGGDYDDVNKTDTCEPFSLPPCTHNKSSTTGLPLCPSGEYSIPACRCASSRRAVRPSTGPPAPVDCTKWDCT